MKLLNTMILMLCICLCALDYSMKTLTSKRKVDVANTEISSIKKDEKNNREMSEKLSKNHSTDQPKEKQSRYIFSDTNLDNQKDNCFDDQKNIFNNELLRVGSSYDETQVKKDALLQRRRLHDKIIQFLNDKIFKDHFRKKYVKKMAEITLNYEFLISYKENYQRYNTSILQPFNLGLTSILNNVLLNLRRDTKFNLDEYEKFDNQLFGQLNLIKGMGESQKELCKLDLNVKKFLYFAELTKLSKFFIKVPELMILDGAFCEYVIDYQLISIYFIKLLLERKNVEEVKVVILFLIKKIFSLSKRQRLDLFAIQDFTTVCSLDEKFLHHFNFYFLFYEMSPTKKMLLKKKISKRNHEYRRSENDDVHIKSVFVVVLYQQLIFFEYNYVNEEDKEKFMDSVEIFLDKDYECTMCEVYKLLGILENLFIYNKYF